MTKTKCVSSIAGRGLFHIHPENAGVIAIEVTAGDLIRVPRGTWHWFNLCDDRRIRAIRLFQDVTGWTPLYTGSGADGNFAPVCFGKLLSSTASRDRPNRSAAMGGDLISS